MVQRYTTISVQSDVSWWLHLSTIINATTIVIINIVTVKDTVGWIWHNGGGNVVYKILAKILQQLDSYGHSDLTDVDDVDRLKALVVIPTCN